MFPEKTKEMPEKTLLADVREGIAKASTFGVVWDFDVRRFLEFRMQFGPGFGSSSARDWATNILNDQSLDGREKMDQIDTYGLFALRV